MDVAARRPRQDHTALVDALDEAIAAALQAPLDADVATALIRRLDDARRIVVRSREEESIGGHDAVPLNVAAETIGVSASRLRRWADAGQIRCTRTAGGHRRFPLAEVRRLARERGTGPGTVRPIEAPRTALPTLAELLDAHGEQLVSAVTTKLYGPGRRGWFADPASSAIRADWLEALAQGARSGDFDAAVAATLALLRQARLHAATLLERYRFTARLGLALMRALHQRGADKQELAAARQLFEALTQAHLNDS